MAKRLTKAERLAAEAKRLAELLAAGDDVLVPPELLADPRLMAARQVWLDLAPRLSALGTLDATSRMHLAMLAVYTSEFAAAQSDILNNGYSVKVKTVSGSWMPRTNPSVERRDYAARMVLELGRHLGLSRLDRLALRDRPGMLGAGPLFDTANVVDVEPVTEPALDNHTRRWLELVKPASAKEN